MRRLPALAITLGLLLLAGLAWWMLYQGGAHEEATGAILRAPGAAAAPASALPVANGEAASGLHASVAAPPDAAATAGPAPMPESYRRALGALTGRVLASDGTPVAGLPLELIGGRRSLVIRSAEAFLQEGGLDFDPIVGRAVTGVDGRFRLVELQPRTLGALLLDPGGPRALLWPLTSTPVSAETRDLGDIVLPATVTLKGRVVDEHGHAVAGARVRATEIPGATFVPDIAQFRAGGGGVFVNPQDDKSFVFVPPPAMSALISRLPVPTALSGDDGSFELAGVKPGLVTLAVDEPSHLVAMQGGIATGAPGGTRELGDVMLGDGETVKGHVLDSKGRPVQGAEVLLGNPMSLGPASGAVLRGPYATDAVGAFSGQGYRAGALWAVARADEHHDWTVVTTLDTGSSAEVHLPGSRTLTLAVQDPQGATVDGAQLYGRHVPDKDIVDLLLAPHPLASVSRDAQGRYVVGDLEPENWEIVVKAAGRPVARDDFDLTAADADGVIRLEEGRSLAVHVVDPTGQPVEWAQIEALADVNDLGAAPLATARTGADGRAWLADLAPGEVYVTACHPSFAIGQAKAEIPPTPAGAPPPPLAEVELALAAGGRIVGTILDQGAAPTQPLMVLLEPTKAAGDEMLPRTTLSDLQGRFSFDRVEAGSTRVEVRDPKTLSSGLSLFESFIDTPLARDTVEVMPSGETQVLLDIGAQYKDMQTGTVSGTLTVNGLPADGWKVRSWGSIRRTVVTDARGRFDLGRLAAGDVSLAVSAPDVQLMEGFTDERTVQLKAGEAKLVDISIATGAIGGRVLSAKDGQPVAGAQVQVRSDAQKGGGRSGRTMTDADGRFRIDPVGSGTYRVSVSAEGHANLVSDPFELRPQEEHTNLVLRLAGNLHVSGTIVIDGTEQPHWMWLIASAADGETRDTATVDKAQHTFAFDGLGPGKWNFQLATDLDTEFETVDLDINADAQGVTLTFKCKPPPAPTPDDKPAAPVETTKTGNGGK